MDPSKIEQIACKYLGVPYRHGGRDLNGLDCLGLIHLFYRDCGIAIPDGDGKPYSPNWVYEDPGRYLRGIKKIGKEVPLNMIQPLDLVYFRLGAFISHGGVMVDSHYFIHVFQKGVVRLTPLNRAWRRRLVGARRLI